jgi:hypothetical protein
MDNYKDELNRTYLTADIKDQILKALEAKRTQIDTKIDSDKKTIDEIKKRIWNRQKIKGLEKDIENNKIDVVTLNTLITKLRNDKPLSFEEIKKINGYAYTSTNPDLRLSWKMSNVVESSWQKNKHLVDKPELKEQPEKPKRLNIQKMDNKTLEKITIQLNGLVENDKRTQIMDKIYDGRQRSLTTDKLQDKFDFLREHIHGSNQYSVGNLSMINSTIDSLGHMKGKTDIDMMEIKKQMGKGNIYSGFIEALIKFKPDGKEKPPYGQYYDEAIEILVMNIELMKFNLNRNNNVQSGGNCGKSHKKIHNRKRRTNRNTKSKKNKKSKRTLRKSSKGKNKSKRRKAK